MFEKEAEEYLIRNLCKTCLTICENNCPHAESEKRAYKDGAEFGYNKANEWHYPSKGEYPKEVEMKKQLTKAKELIKEMLSILPKENIDGVYEITEEAEQFIREDE